MIQPVFKRSRGGLIAAGLFLLTVMSIFAWIFFVASKNTADSGESGLLLLPFAMPWITMIPNELLGLGTAFGCIFFNSFILYCAFGGFRLKGTV